MLAFLLDQIPAAYCSNWCRPQQHQERSSYVWTTKLRYNETRSKEKGTFLDFCRFLGCVRRSTVGPRGNPSVIHRVAHLHTLLSDPAGFHRAVRATSYLVAATRALCFTHKPRGFSL